MRADRIALLLPEVYQRTIVPHTPIAAILDVMAEQHEPIEQVLARLPEYFDPQRTPDRFVPFLAHWVDLDRWLDDGTGTFDTGTGRLRQLIAAAAQLSRRRGTAAGLRDALEWATGVAGVRVDEAVPDAAGRIRPFHVVVTLPTAAESHRALVRRIVQQEKPAHITADIVYVEDEAPPPATPPPPTPVGAPASAAEPPPVPPTLPVVTRTSTPSEPAFPGAETN
jgi:phage tail-like protein